MNNASRRISVLGIALLASGLMAGSAFAQAECDNITGPRTVQVGEPFTLCAPENSDPEYVVIWYLPGEEPIESRCVEFPNGILSPGTLSIGVLYGIPDQQVKCDLEIKIEERKEEGRCWLTGGGAKFEVAGGPRHSFGGNINPGCSPTAGDGGNWNNIDHVMGVHFQGRSIEVIRCGNIPGIEPGSESPVTPFNFIEFRGTGRLKGTRGNNFTVDPVYFFGHYEDRNEPGSSGNPNPATRDRYFLHVYSNPADPAGSTLMLIDVDGNPATVDPVTITHGNMQLHWRPCEESRTSSSGSMTPSRTLGETPSLPSAVSFAVGPNPTSTTATMSFSLPGNAAVSIKVFDVAGREVRDLSPGWTTAGSHSVSWDLSDRGGNRVDRGIYFVRLGAGDTSLTRVVSVTQ